MDALDEIANTHARHLRARPLAWLLAQPGITSSIASVTSDSQLDDLIAATSLQLTPGEIRRLNEVSAPVAA